MEEEIRAIFAKDNPSQFLIELGVQLIKDWKVENNWVEDNTPAIKK